MEQGLGRLRNKSAVVTGAAKGIGQATAELFSRGRPSRRHRRGRRGPRCSALPACRGGLEAEVASVVGDVSSSEDAKKMIGTCVERFGRVDVPVANAGAITLSTIDDTAPEDWDHVMVGDVPVLQIRHRGDARDGGGSIVCLSSISGLAGQKEQAAYSPAKFVARGPGCRSGRALPLRRG